MKKTFLTVFAAGLLCLAPAVQAAPAADLDLSKFTCKELLEDAKRGPEIIVWAEGYINGTKNDEVAVIEEDFSLQLNKHIDEYCTANPEKTVMQAMQAMKTAEDAPAAAPAAVPAK